MRNMSTSSVFFWQTEEGKKVGPGCLSQWARYGFVVGGAYYRYAEQYMMAEKARLFHDDATLDKIMDAKSPMIIKNLGRSVKGRAGGVWDEKDSAKWDAVRFDVALRGNFAKFSQNDALRDYLLSTGSAILAEASPKDAVWGIGIDAETAENTPQSKWPGKNLLGQVLMKVREKLKSGAGDEKSVSDDKKLLAEFLEAEASQREIKASVSRAKAPTPSRKKKVGVVDHAAQDPGADTDPSFQRELKSVAENMSAVALSIEGCDGTAGDLVRLKMSRNFSKDEQSLFNKFDKLYRGHVYRFLLRPKDKGGCGFVKIRNGNENIPVQKVSSGGDEISGAEVFAAVWAKLFGVRYELPRGGRIKSELKSYFLDFDFTESNVGHGAFRAYLNMLTESVVSDLIKREMVALKDVHGRVMHDENGRIIYVPRSDLDTVDVKKSEIAVAQELSDREFEKAQKLRAKKKLELFYLAYFRLHADENICPKWFRPFVEEIFEQGKNRAEVEARAIKTKAAPSRTSFYTELCRFREKVRKLADELWDSVYGYNVVCDEKGEVRHVMEAKEALEREWDELALYVGYRRMHDIRYNVIRGLVEAEEMKILLEKDSL